MEPLSEVPVIDVRAFLEKDVAKMQEQCRLVAQSLHEFGILIVKDSRVSEADNNKFIDMIESYFAQPEKTLMEDVRPELRCVVLVCVCVVLRSWQLNAQ